jgi:hypothetical protein
MFGAALLVGEEPVGAQGNQRICEEDLEQDSISPASVICAALYTASGSA